VLPCASSFVGFVSLGAPTATAIVSLMGIFAVGFVLADDLDRKD
jgi:hypothetical protein